MTTRDLGEYHMRSRRISHAISAHRALIRRPRQLSKFVLMAREGLGEGIVLGAADTWTFWLDAELDVRLDVASTWHMTTTAAAAAAAGVRALVCGAAGGHAVAKVPIIRRYL